MSSFISVGVVCGLEEVNLEYMVLHARDDDVETVNLYMVGNTCSFTRLGGSCFSNG